jgi:class 3 adenylate cyclase
MNAGVERKLTNILSADVFGYSRLMGLDEAGTLATLNAYRTVMIVLIEQHRGRAVNTTGDHLLAEFGSPVMAVQCAVEIQRQLAERNQKLDPDRQMWFRIGIHLGDVIAERDDLFGDDVNIAARLQSIAEPGGVLISGTVFDHVKNKLTLNFDALGPQRLKNIDFEVPAYRAVLGAESAVTAVPSKDAEAKHQAEKWHRFKVSAARTGALIALFALINLFSWDGELWFQWPALGVLFLFAIRSTIIFRK